MAMMTVMTTTTTAAQTVIAGSWDNCNPSSNNNASAL
jgi:hypothetical protein